MGAAVAASPVLAAGPPGWAVFGVVVVGTAAYGLAMSSSRGQTGSRSRTEARSRTVEECPDPWSVRVHAQGRIIGGTSGSTIGAPRILKQSPVTVAEGIGLAGETFAMLTRRQKKELELAHESCKRFIASRPPRGFLGSQGFRVKDRKGGNRIDLDSFGPSENFQA